MSRGVSQESAAKESIEKDAKETFKGNYRDKSMPLARNAERARVVIPWARNMPFASVARHVEPFFPEFPMAVEWMLRSGGTSSNTL